MPRKDKTVPVPPPPGKKWAVSRSIMGGFQIGLYPLDVEVDEDGRVTRKRKGQRKPERVMDLEPHAYFDREKEVRSASKRLLRRISVTDREQASLMSMRRAAERVR